MVDLTTAEHLDLHHHIRCLHLLRSSHNHFAALPLVLAGSFATAEGVGATAEQVGDFDGPSPVAMHLPFLDRIYPTIVDYPTQTHGIRAFGYATADRPD